MRPDGLYNWTMKKHILFTEDKMCDGYHPTYTIHPPMGEGFYCPAGFEFFSIFNFENLRRALEFIGYKEKAIGLAEYAIKCVFNV